MLFHLFVLVVVFFLAFYVFFGLCLAVERPKHTTKRMKPAFRCFSDSTTLRKAVAATGQKMHQCGFAHVSQDFPMSLAELHSFLRMWFMAISTRRILGCA